LLLLCTLKLKYWKYNRIFKIETRKIQQCSLCILEDKFSCLGFKGPGFGPGLEGTGLGFGGTSSSCQPYSHIQWIHNHKSGSEVNINDQANQEEGGGQIQFKFFFHLKKRYKIVMGPHKGVAPFLLFWGWAQNICPISPSCWTC
jgi:hypothetical protein